MTSQQKPMPVRIQKAIDALRRGEFIILVDSEDRENEGDLVLAAEHATPEKINFFIRNACGLVCLSMTGEQIDRLGLPPMVQENATARKTAFTISVEAKVGVSTGISAADRALTIQVASNPNSTGADLVSPGHIFPLRAVDGGVVARAGHTEGSIELCKLAGLKPAAVICEIMNEDGTMSRRDDLDQFAKKYNLEICSIEELIQYQMQHTEWMTPSTSVPFPSSWLPKDSSLELQSFRNENSKSEHAVLKTTKLSDAPWVRIHSECLTGDVFGSDRCDCGAQLRFSLNYIAQKNDGLVVYLTNQEGRGIGLWNKVQAYHLQDQGRDTVEANHELGFPADLRSYVDAAKILSDLGIKKVKLITQNPTKKAELERFGIEVVEILSPDVNASPLAAKYLEAKRTRLGHWVNN